MNRIAEILGRFGLTLQIAKTAFAAALSWSIATSLLHSEYPYFAAVAAIITVQVTVADSVDKATQRIIGIIGGVLLSMLLGHWFKIGAISIFFIILIGMGISKALRMNPQIISQVAISSLLVLAFGQTREGYALERIIETIIGSAIAVFINALIIPQNAVPDVEKNILTFSNLSAATLISLTTLLDYMGIDRKTGRSEVDALIKEAEKCRKTLDLAGQSLKYNPLLTHKRVRLSQLTQTIKQLESITIQIRGIRRSLADLQINQYLQLEQRYVQQLKLAMAATAKCIAAYGQTSTNASEENQNNLNEAINQALIEQEYCLNNLGSITSLSILRDIGSILSDLGRIVSEVDSLNPISKNTKADSI
ncbi:aromatic acid exporter family protein [Pontibacter silvestris]|uniref:Aromatic acid exporter family protein n=1 Tax=Pontibacter silvestris TaxID=2305183 RepID=A0ABW4WW50_9BACT|nr:FUSC family protein [Pontibacter silvestris]MCC9136878.1 aromatic acid exporter family protein [Pontibacter silvestris]